MAADEDKQAKTFTLAKGKSGKKVRVYAGIYSRHRTVDKAGGTSTDRIGWLFGLRNSKEVYVRSGKDELGGDIFRRTHSERTYLGGQIKLSRKYDAAGRLLSASWSAPFGTVKDTWTPDRRRQTQAVNSPRSWLHSRQETLLSPEGEPVKWRTMKRRVGPYSMEIVPKKDGSGETKARRFGTMFKRSVEYDFNNETKTVEYRLFGLIKRSKERHMTDEEMEKVAERKERKKVIDEAWARSSKEKPEPGRIDLAASDLSSHDALGRLQAELAQLQARIEAAKEELKRNSLAHPLITPANVALPLTNQFGQVQATQALRQEMAGFALPSSGVDNARTTRTSANYRPAPVGTSVSASGANSTSGIQGATNGSRQGVNGSLVSSAAASQVQATQAVRQEMAGFALAPSGLGASTVGTTTTPANVNTHRSATSARGASRTPGIQGATNGLQQGVNGPLVSSATASQVQATQALRQEMAGFALAPSGLGASTVGATTTPANLNTHRSATNARGASRTPGTQGATNGSQQGVNGSLVSSVTANKVQETQALRQAMAGFALPPSGVGASMSRKPSFRDPLGAYQAQSPVTLVGRKSRSNSVSSIGSATSRSSLYEQKSTEHTR